MAQTFVTGRGVVVQIRRELGSGYEGSVYEVLTNSDQAAKLYHQMPDARKQAKLSYMVATADARLRRNAAWPLETLHRIPNGPIADFLMPCPS
jgi:DNA-binding helix-hairpin-helix protein with protein kinase domain